MLKKMLYYSSSH